MEEGVYRAANYSDVEEHASGAKVEDIWWKYVVSDAPLYKWKAKCGGMKVSDANESRPMNCRTRS